MNINQRWKEMEPEPIVQRQRIDDVNIYIISKDGKITNQIDPKF